MSLNSIADYIVTFLASVAVIILSFIVQNVLQDRRLFENTKADLIAELKQNKEHQVASTYISLEDDAYKRFRQTGFLSRLSNENQTILREIYSRIHEKNELILIYRMALQSGREALITGGETPSPIAVTITNITREIANRLDDLFIDLK